METSKKNLLFIYLGVLMFLFSQVSHVSSASDTISTNQPLVGLQTIVSSGDILELGVFNPAPGSGKFYIGMWYKQDFPWTIVWVANRESPTLRHDSYSILEISDGNLILYDYSDGNTALWSTGLNSSSGKDVQAVLLDNGNLVLRDGPTSSAAVLWQSFDHPSDNWLPGAKIWFNNNKFGSQGLTSWKSLIDPSPGRYSLQFDPNITHSLIIVWNGSKSYWSSGPWDNHFEIFKGFPYYTTLSFKLNMDESYITYSVDPPSAYRLVMDVSGQLM